MLEEANIYFKIVLFTYFYQTLSINIFKLLTESSYSPSFTVFLTPSSLAGKKCSYLSIQLPLFYFFSCFPLCSGSGPLSVINWASFTFAFQCRLILHLQLDAVSLLLFPILERDIQEYSLHFIEVTCSLCNLFLSDGRIVNNFPVTFLSGFLYILCYRDHVLDKYQVVLSSINY